MAPLQPPTMCPSMAHAMLMQTPPPTMSHARAIAPLQLPTTMSPSMAHPLLQPPTSQA